MCSRFRIGFCFATGLFVAAPGAAQEPLSAIDWLSETVRSETAGPARPPAFAARPPLPGVLTGRGPDGAPLPGSVEQGTISVRSIDGTTIDATGLLPADRSGLPAHFWGGARGDELAARLAQVETDTLPVLRDLLQTILLTEFDPPPEGTGRGALFLARVDKLLDLGALEQALALISGVGADSPELFRRWFDIALLLGEEDTACQALRDRPGLNPSYPARVFCLARGGDWTAAALTLRSADALGLLTEEEESLLTRFLDSDMVDLPAEVAPQMPSPLVWRMLEAIGEQIPTRTLPLAFAQADLRGNAGWRAQLEAAERLARSGALAPNRLLGLYTERRPAASGGIWDRVAAVQRLDSAVTADDTAGVAAALPPAWEQMAAAGLETVFAETFEGLLPDPPPDGEARSVAFRMGMLTPRYSAVAEAHDPATPEEAYLVSLALDLAPLPAGQGQPQNELHLAIHDGLASDSPPQESAALLGQGRLGEAVLFAMQRLRTGISGEPAGIVEGLATLRHAGLEDIARRAALQLVILDLRG